MTKFNVIRHLSRVTAILLLVLLAIVILSAGIGPVYIPPVEVGKVVANHLPIVKSVSHFPVSSIANEIIWEIRIPRTLLGVFVGMCLAMAGVALQGLLRNPLADPYMIGVSSGAALGAGIAVLLGLSGVLFGLGI
ncbi:MAG: iron chelate uptake ABC transporter family permease subunit, partial [Armatimonadota bacterium]